MMRWINSLKFMVGALLISGDCIPNKITCSSDNGEYRSEDVWMTREQYLGIRRGISVGFSIDSNSIGIHKI